MSEPADDKERSASINGCGRPVCKTRALARSMIEGGKVHYNGQRTKPGKQVEVGATIRLRQGFDQ